MAKEFKLTPGAAQGASGRADLSEDGPGEGSGGADQRGPLLRRPEREQRVRRGQDRSRGKLYSRIAEVENILSNYVVIEENEDDGGSSIRLGSTVTVLDKEFNEEETYKIVGSQEADPMNGVISEDSPFGRALLGKNAGDDVVVDAPAGPVEYKILKVER